MNDAIAVLISFAYVFATLGVAELVRRLARLPTEFTRKFVHVAVGMWAFGTAALFSTVWGALIPPLAFVGLNYLSYRRGLFAAMETGDKTNLGTVYFPLAFAGLIALFFETNRALMVIALMPMTWGDAFAAIIGKRWGRHQYAVLGAQRSLEGSAAMLLFSLLGAVLAGLALGLAAPNAVVLGSALAVAATLVEALSVRGLDNLFVPAACAAVCSALQGLAVV
ncbi:MAG: phosphatidate cytidylyltransferase [Anaerolineae bacterium]|nr:hypothetical protein [Thermoflexales bacterium]MDW8396349.1 phosphatidate cytidylyltransferase [Anaerolineae bacterium]